MSQQTRQSFKLESSGTLTAATGKDQWVAPFPGQVISVMAVVKTAPTDADLILDLNVNGTSIFTTKPTIVAGATKTADPVAPDADPANRFAAEDVISLDIDQVGSTVAGADLDVVVQYIAS